MEKLKEKQISRQMLYHNTKIHTNLGMNFLWLNKLYTGGITMIKMKELPYPLDALEPYYNRETLDIHYNKDMWIIQTKHKIN